MIIQMKQPHHFNIKRYFIMLLSMYVMATSATEYALAKSWTLVQTHHREPSFLPPLDLLEVSLKDKTGI